ncbi:MAG: hypothetical protein ACOYBV_06615 [Candidatus Avilachnospira sp.]|jgi:hypothetical protein
MRKTVKILIMASAFSALMATTAFAARINSVDIKAVADDDAPLEAGKCVDPYFYTNSHNYSISGVEDLDADSSPTRTHTYEITLDANDGNRFSDNVNVTYSGVTEVTRKRVEDDGYTLELRVEAYPYYMFPAPGNLHLDEGEERAKWDSVSNADRYEYVIDWTDRNGDDKTKHGTTSSERVDISSYIRKYDDDRYDDCEIVGMAVRATGDAGKNPRTADGEWAIIGDVDLGDYDDDYDSWSDAIGRESNTSGSTGSLGSPSQPSNQNGWVQDLRGAWHWNTPNGYATGWIHDGSNWYYCNQSGTMLTGWINDGNGWYYCDASGKMLTGWVNDGSNWYYCDDSGRMQAGWLLDGSNWFYLNPISGAGGQPYGAMLTGWQAIDGNTYYFNPVSNGTRGAMLVGSHVIDGVGYYFNTNHDGTYGRLITG